LIAVEDVDTWPTGRLLSAAARLVESRFDSFLTDLDLTHAGLIALHHLSGGPLSQRELARRSRVTDQTMSRTIERLSRTGHVHRTANPVDRRSTVVAANEKGTGALAAALAEERRFEQDLGYDKIRPHLIALLRTHL
jgi:DNA-binding MarR family transcriptional regulator